MSQRVRTYDPDNVSVIFGGVPLTGFADGTFVSVAQNEDSFSLTVGADGEACRSKSNNRSARITLTLLQTSLANQFLAAIHNADILTPSGDGIYPLMVKDNSGTTLCVAEKAWITKPSDSSFAREAESREWVFETNELVNNPGGTL